MERLLVLDLEATCWQEGERPRGAVKEIIEIGGAILETAPDGRWELSDTFSLLVRPRDSSVGQFCEELTGITQKGLDDFGMTLEYALEILNGIEADQWASWGTWDLMHIRNECKRKGISYYKYLPALHLNIKALYSSWYRVGKSSLEKAVANLGKVYIGKPHRGEDDAENAAEILRDILNSNEE